MEVKGKVVSILEVQTGEGKNGTWSKGGFVLEVDGKFPKTVAIELWKEKLDDCPKVDEYVTAHINIESREFNSKWYTNVQGWKIEKGDKTEAPLTAEAKASDDTDELPF